MHPKITATPLERLRKRRIGPEDKESGTVIDECSGSRSFAESAQTGAAQREGSRIVKKK